MNWLDIIILIVLIGSAVFGMRTGIITALIMTIGGFVGWLIAGQLADDLGSTFSDSVSSDTLVTVVSYIIIISAGLMVGSWIAKIVRPILSVATLGISSLIDSLGGITLGLLIGIVISSSIIIFSARFAYDFENIDNDTVTSIADQIDVKTVRLGLQNRLVDSTSVDIFLGTIHKLPANSLGFIPSDFQISIELLEDAKEEEEEDNDDDE
ncbi:MAG: CvpA family protein [SAR202 cluster bacterium]|nr:CvpA family protein [SAR202 cluster bacterium]